MINESWKISGNDRKVLCFAFILCLWISEFQVCQGSQNNILSDDVQSEEKFGEVQNVEKITIGLSDTCFDNEKNCTRPWISKCCMLNHGYTFENKSRCVETEDEFLPVFEDRPDYSATAKDLPVKTRYEYFIGDPCLDGKYILDPAVYPDDQFSIYSNGTLLHLDQLYKKEEFCLETLNGSIRAFVCFGTNTLDHEVNFTFVLYAVGLLLSIPFLLVTALIHLCIDHFRDLRGKSLSCHVLCLATGYLVLAIVQLASDQLNETLCIAAGFTIQFFFVASFFWLNVISFDTWRCINNEFRCNQELTKSSPEKLIFYFYCLYGWYGPIVLSIITLIMDLEPAIPESYLKPNFGLKSCWFYSDDAALPYFYGPVALVIFGNVILFFMSARKIFAQQRVEKKNRDSNRNSLEEISKTNNSVQIYFKALICFLSSSVFEATEILSNFENSLVNITGFYLNQFMKRWKCGLLVLGVSNLKECIYLFCIMGINWAAEVISWAVGGSQTIWLITDIFNALQGIMVFYLFVVKPKRIRNEVRRRIGLIWKKIINCNCQYREENKRCSRHWHANTTYKEPCNENDEFLNKLLTTAV